MSGCSQQGLKRAESVGFYKDDEDDLDFSQNQEASFCDEILRLLESYATFNPHAGFHLYRGAVRKGEAQASNLGLAGSRMSSENLPLEIPNYTPEEITQLYRVMTPSEKKEFDELISGGRSAETLTLEAAGPETWLRTLGSRTFTGTFADFHYDLWEWYWRIAGKRRAEIPLTNQELVYLALWFRGAGKSSHVEWLLLPKALWWARDTFSISAVRKGRPRNTLLQSGNVSSRRTSPGIIHN